MSDIGTIVEIEPEDGLGWIEMPNGDRVRFGGTACKGFVPAVGMAVEVLATRPGYGGTVKATELKKASQAAAPASAPAAAAAAAPRTALHTIQAAGVRADEVLLTLLARADLEDRLHADLEAVRFEVQPQPGPAMGCPNPWFYGVAFAGNGDAYGLYTHPLFEGHATLPWLRWDHERAALRFLANDTGALLAGLLAEARESGVDGAIVDRLHADLVKLGMPDAPAAPLGDGEAQPWLPPDDGALRPVDDYLAETDGGEMERGLLAHAFGRADERAATALRQLYVAWGWSLPPWAS